MNRKKLAQNSYMKAANGKVISEISTGEKRTYLKLEDIPLFRKICSSLQRTRNFMIMQESTYPA
ncbi:hypothetical protein [Peribacillus frigoritolerans]|uniref:hypothetical protein n=1 Tax=Peribacillus frigoritolerans TaxID=450367 RepID=UPI001E426475|nr:hypothetical protein [Peribacillus frigoritolerans]